MPLDAIERDAAIDALATAVRTGYVLPERSEPIAAALHAANREGRYNGKTAPEFVALVNETLATASHDKHLAVFYQPLSTPSSPAPQPLPVKERFNFGFGKLERLRGNVGYLDIATFSELSQSATATASALLSTLNNFDAIILDLRGNGGGNTPMMAFVASHFFDSPVHLTDIYWRDTNQTSQFWTEAPAAGAQRPTRQPLYILTSARTFSAAEDFCYSLRNLNRAVIVGETTGGGAHSGRGLVRLTNSFTAFVPVGRSLSPITKTNWEGVGVAPDVEVTTDALNAAHLLALKTLVERESDGQWKQALQRSIEELSRAAVPAPK